MIRINKRAIGCNAKVSIETLLQLSSAKDISDLESDCGVFSVGGERIASTIDTVFPFSTDIRLFAEGAVLHCANDLVCKGIKPLSASFSFGVGADLSSTEAVDLSTHVKRFLGDLGISLDNCHSFNSSDTSITLSMVGAFFGLAEVIKGRDYRMILTKPLGAVHFLEGIDEPASIAERVIRSNCLDAIACLKEFAAAATTDVSGYGLLGHIVLAARKNGLEVDLHYDRVPLLAGRKDSEIPCSAVINLGGFSEYIDEDSFEGAPIYSLFSGETSGPILVFVDALRYEEFSVAMNALGHNVYDIGSARASGGRGLVRGRRYG